MRLGLCLVSKYSLIFTPFREVVVSGLKIAIYSSSFSSSVLPTPKSNYPEYGISGRANYITEKGKLQLGLSGNKAQHADLTVELVFISDLGVTNSRYPEEIFEGQLQMQDGSMMGLTYYQLDISAEEM